MRSWIILAVFLAKVVVQPVFGADPPGAQRWGPVFNPDGKAPLNAFTAYYFNSNDPSRVIATEEVRDIAINYAWSDFHGIKSEDFAAYWVGRLEFKQDEQRTIEIAHGWSKARVYVDGELVYDLRGEKRIPFLFKKGRRLVEVEFSNDWHTTDFRVAFLSASMATRLTPQQISEQLRGRLPPGAAVHYVGLYESKARDLSVQVALPPSTQPVVLVLSSYSAVKWTLTPPPRADIRAVIFGSHEPGTEVVGIKPGRTLLLPAVSGIASHEGAPRCSCAGSIYHCEGSPRGMLASLDAVEKLVGARVTSFVGEYGASHVVLPGLLIDDSVRAQAEDRATRIEQESARCGAWPDVRRP